jgi:hypothetical protein
MKAALPSNPEPLPAWLDIRIESIGDYRKWLASDEYAAWVNREPSDRYRERLVSAAMPHD